MSEEKNTQTTQVEETSTQQEVNEKTETQEQEQTQEETQQETKETQKTESAEEVEKRLKRDLSKKFGVNLFDEKETDEFLKSLENKVDKSELEKQQEELQKYKEYEQKFKETQFENAILKNNVNEDYRDKVKKLAGVEMQEAEDMTEAEAVEKVVKDFPEFTKKSKRGGMDINTSASNLDPNESYIKRYYERDANGKLIPKRR